MQLKTIVLGAALAAQATMAVAEERRSRIYFPRHVKRQFENSTVTSFVAFPPQENTPETLPEPTTETGLEEEPIPGEEIPEVEIPQDAPQDVPQDVPEVSSVVESRDEEPAFFTSLREATSNILPGLGDALSEPAAVSSEVEVPTDAADAPVDDDTAAQEPAPEPTSGLPPIVVFPEVGDEASSEVVEDAPVSSETVEEEPISSEEPVDEVVEEEPVSSEVVAEPLPSEGPVDEVVEEEPASSEVVAEPLPSEQPVDEVVDEEPVSSEVVAEPVPSEQPVDEVVEEEPVSSEVAAEPIPSEEPVSSEVAAEPIPSEQPADETTEEVGEETSQEPIERPIEEDQTSEEPAAVTSEEPAADETTIPLPEESVDDGLVIGPSGIVSSADPAVPEETPDVTETGDLLNPIVEPVESGVSEVVDPVVSDVVDPVVSDVVDPVVSDVVDPVVSDVVDPVESSVSDDVVAPVPSDDAGANTTEPLEPSNPTNELPIDSELAEPVSSILSEVVDPAESAVSDVLPPAPSDDAGNSTDPLPSESSGDLPEVTDSDELPEPSNTDEDELVTDLLPLPTDLPSDIVSDITDPLPSDAVTDAVPSDNVTDPLPTDVIVDPPVSSNASDIDLPEETLEPSEGVPPPSGTTDLPPDETLLPGPDESSIPPEDFISVPPGETTLPPPGETTLPPNGTTDDPSSASESDDLLLPLPTDEPSSIPGGNDTASEPVPEPSDVSELPEPSSLLPSGADDSDEPLPTPSESDNVLPPQEPSVSPEPAPETTVEPVPEPTPTDKDDSWISTTLIVDPPPSETPDQDQGGNEDETTTTTTRPAPSDLPGVITPGGDQNDMAQPEGTILLQLGFLYAENYEFVSNNPMAAAQIFTYLPLALAEAAGVDAGQIKVTRLVPFNTSESLGYITTLARFYYPESMAEQLSMDVQLQNSALYNHPRELIANLTQNINPAINIYPGQENIPGADGNGDGNGDDSSGGNDLFDNNESGSTPIQKGTAAAIGIGAVGVAAAYGAAMFLIARRYKQKRQTHRRASSISAGSSEMRYTGEGSPAMMGGALLSREFSGHGGYGGAGGAGPGGRDSHGSGRSGAGTVRTAQISAPVAAENSLGWN